MCQLTSPSLKIDLELPSAAASKSTPTSAGRKSLPAPRVDAVSIGACSTILSTRARTRLGRDMAAIDEVKHDPDRLRRHEEELRTVGQANEQIKAAENPHSRDKRRGRCAELALCVRLTPAKDEHRRTDRDEGRERPGIGERRDRGQRDQAGED